MKEKRKEKDFYTTKHKQKKKKSKSKKKYDSSSDSKSSDDSMQWVEAPPHSTKEKLKKESPESEHSKTEELHHTTVTEKRESWMNEESFVATVSKDEIYSSSRQKRLDSAKALQEIEERVKKERELNPHWKNKGIGLPQKETNVESLSLPSASVGDGGYSWLKKAYYRIQEQAQSEGRSMEDIAVERWGSLQKLTTLIEEAEKRMKSHPDFKNSKCHLNDRVDQDNRYNRSHFRKPSYTSESEKTFNTPFCFKKPSSDSKSHKLLNQFKSSKKADSRNYHNETDQRSLHENFGNSKHLSNQKSEKPYRDDLKRRESNSKNETRIPSWKKPEYSTEKLKEAEISVKSVTSISHSSEVTEERKSNRSALQSDSIPVMYSEEDLSKLAAKQIKAEIIGDATLAEKLKKQLDIARETVKLKGFVKQLDKQEVILTKIDSQGQSRPVQTTQDKIENYKHKNNKFFEHDSRYSLKQMFEREKLTTVDDHVEMFVEATAHSNEIDEIDYESGHISKKLCKKLSSTREEERDIGKAIQQHQKRTSALERCAYCLEQPQMKKYLIIDVGESIYLCLPSFQSIADGHCLIVPKAHVSSFLLLDENEWKEVNDFKNQLRCMFRSEDKSVIFLETSMNFKHFPHAVIECIPVPPEEGDMAPFYFKKAIQESETEWAHNKKLVDLTNKGLRLSVPKNLPYFHVEFDPQIHQGFAHVIEDEKYFPRNFGKEIVGGMLGIDYNCLYKNKKEDAFKKCEDVAAFEKRWKKFKDVS